MNVEKSNFWCVVRKEAYKGPTMLPKKKTKLLNYPGITVFTKGNNNS